MQDAGEPATVPALQGGSMGSVEGSVINTVRRTVPGRREPTRACPHLCLGWRGKASGGKEEVASL